LFGFWKAEARRKTTKCFVGWAGSTREREMERNRRQAGLNEMKTYIY
jgi:hypothetical protein